MLDRKARSGMILDFGLRILDLNTYKRSQVQGSTFRVRDKGKIEDPKSS